MKQSVEILQGTTTKPDMSRRAFMTCLTLLGVGTTAAMTFGLTHADALPLASSEARAKEVSSDEKLAEANQVGVDPDDPRQAYAQYYYRRRRRVYRRAYRRTRRYVRRAYRYRRRVYRRTRRVVRRAYRRYYY
jgi:hypothetical protein